MQYMLSKFRTFLSVNDLMCLRYVKAAWSVIFDLLILEKMFLFFKISINTQIQVNILPFL